jgi:hypothetical protein
MWGRRVLYYAGQHHHEEEPVNARETADRHAGYVAAGNPRAAGADFTPEALQAFIAQGKNPPRGTNKYEILSERQEGENAIFDIKYSSDQDTLTVRSTWAKIGDDWKIIKTEPVS